MNVTQSEFIFPEEKTQTEQQSFFDFFLEMHEEAKYLISFDPFIDRSIKFMNADGKTVGSFSWEHGIFRFDGKADASAKIFVDYVWKNFKSI